MAASTDDRNAIVYLHRSTKQTYLDVASSHHPPSSSLPLPLPPEQPVLRFTYGRADRGGALAYSQGWACIGALLLGMGAQAGSTTSVVRDCRGVGRAIAGFAC